VEILNGAENYVPGSGKIHYRFDGGTYLEAPLSDLGGDLYEGTLPNTKPGDQPEFYFSAQGDGGTTVFAPFNAPATVYDYDVYFVDIVLEDDFETNTGWTVENVNITTGAFERANPNGTDAQPEDDHTPNGTLCYVTGDEGGSIGNDDVDGGPTRLISPTLDLSSGDVEMSFYLWFYHSDNGVFEPLEIHLSNNDGSTWTKVADLNHAPQWGFYAYNVGDYVTPTAQVKVRFTAEDNPNDSVVEALVDDFMLRRFNFDASLYADGYEMAASSGAVVNFSLDAGPAHGNRQYLLMASLTGTEPGFDLPGGTHVPLNWDAFTNLALSLLGSPLFQNFTGTLDGLGAATATFDTQGALDPLLVGETFSFVFVLNQPWNFASNAIGVDVLP
jgi:hypothetical protein